MAVFAGWLVRARSGRQDATAMRGRTAADRILR